MNKRRYYLRDVAPYILVIAALCVFTGLYINTEKQRYSDVILMSRAMEIQTRISDVHERLTILSYSVSDAEKSGKKPDIPVLQLELIKFNLNHTTILPYIDQFLTVKD